MKTEKTPANTPFDPFTLNDVFQDAEVISTYTRQEAIEDGVLVDISDLAGEAGFRRPVAVTRALFSSLEPREDEKASGQDLTGRLWDLLNVLRCKGRQGGRELRFSFHVQRRDGRAMPNAAMEKVGSAGGGMAVYSQEVKALCGPGDNWEPVITIMLPSED